MQGLGLKCRERGLLIFLEEKYINHTRYGDVFVGNRFLRTHVSEVNDVVLVILSI